VLDLLDVTDHLTAILLAGIVLYTGARGLYRRTAGSRRATRRNLNSIAIGNPVGHVEGLFGQPIFVKQYAVRSADLTPAEHQPSASLTLEWRLYNATHGWLTLHVVEGTTVGYGFTVTDRRFRYDVAQTTFGEFNGILGRDSFADLEPNEPGQVFRVGGASEPPVYVEEHYSGNSTNYHRFRLGQVQGGVGGANPGLLDLKRLPPGTPLSSMPTSPAEPMEDADFQRLLTFRKSTNPNTLVVIAPFPEYPLMEPWAGNAVGVVDAKTMLRFRDSAPKGWLFHASATQTVTYRRVAVATVLLAVASLVTWVVLLLRSN